MKSFPFKEYMSFWTIFFLFSFSELHNYEVLLLSVVEDSEDNMVSLDLPGLSHTLHQYKSMSTPGYLFCATSFPLIQQFCSVV